jgi:hypothetical protein
MINNDKKCSDFFPFLVSFYISVLLVTKNAFKRVFIFFNGQNDISSPKLRDYKIFSFKI